jgi:8-oxo-dGTP pyrophosphatase MutT (NUDIX family)
VDRRNGREASRVTDASNRSTGRTPSKPQLSATVVILRDGSLGLEVLLLQRTARHGGDGGAWVFPGGRVEDIDHGGDMTDSARALQSSAVRETREEAGIELDGTSLLYISRWITPEIAQRRFDTYFYATRVAADTEVQVDGSEIRTHRWVRPDDAIAASRTSEMRLAPPTFVTTSWLVRQESVEAAHATLAKEPITTFEPRICAVSDGACMLYPGDAGYQDHNPERPGARHRLWALSDGMRYERGPR